MQAIWRILASPAGNYSLTPLPSSPPEIKALQLFSQWLPETSQLLSLPYWLRWKAQCVSRVLELSRLLVSTPYITRSDSHKGFALKIHDNVFQRCLVASNYPDTELTQKQRSMPPIRRLAGSFPPDTLVPHPPRGWVTVQRKEKSLHPPQPPALLSSRKLTRKDEICMYWGRTCHIV